MFSCLRVAEAYQGRERLRFQFAEDRSTGTNTAKRAKVKGHKNSLTLAPFSEEESEVQSNLMTERITLPVSIS